MNPLWVIWGYRASGQDMFLFMAQTTQYRLSKALHPHINPRNTLKASAFYIYLPFQSMGTFFFSSFAFHFYSFSSMAFSSISSSLFLFLSPSHQSLLFILFSRPSPPLPCCAFPSPISTTPLPPHISYITNLSLLPCLLKAMCWATWVTHSSRRASWAVRNMAASSTSAPPSSRCRTCCCPTRPTSLASWSRSGKHPGPRSSPSASCCGWAQSTDVSQNY